MFSFHSKRWYEPIAISHQQHQFIACTSEHTSPNMQVSAAVTLVWAKFKMFKTNQSRLTKCTVCLGTDILNDTTNPETNIYILSRRTYFKSAKLFKWNPKFRKFPALSHHYIIYLCQRLRIPIYSLLALRLGGWAIRPSANLRHTDCRILNELVRTNK